MTMAVPWVCIFLVRRCRSESGYVHDFSDLLCGQDARRFTVARILGVGYPFCFGILWTWVSSE
ncbi:unnamed protein product [Brassica rapa]|uniref:Uncharacterized protein n=2 Tax=Brassica TaxID=3705 RepID=A0A8D9CSZ1_BRACM|nr:unnamed protein product [Brassica napus]CAG7864310.1 unnamed protein product [Brassica rapa]